MKKSGGLIVNKKHSFLTALVINVLNLVISGQCMITAVMLSVCLFLF